MATYNNQALPPPPGQPPNFAQNQQQQYQQYQQQQPQYQQQQQQHQQYPPQPPLHSSQQKPRAQTRKSRSFSFNSNRSHGSNKGSELVETSAEKEAKRLHSKADPTLAMNEAEPAAVATTVKSSLASLRNMEHKDLYGNPIAEPDRSNPTRSRWERPLDTIRGFEAAIDGGYNNRKSFIRQESDSAANWNRRSSYYGNPNGGRFPRESYYGSRPQSAMFRPESSHMDHRQGGMGPRDSYYDQQQGFNNGYSSGPSGRRGYPRMASEPHFNTYRQQDPNVYPLPNNQQSYETVASGSGSGTSGEPAGYQTDPTSSDNSSIERRQSPPKRQPEPVNDYGIGFSQNSTYQPPAFTVGVNGSNARAGPSNANYPGRAPNNYGAPPPVPRKEQSTILRKPTASSAMAAPVEQRPAAMEKRKSWFARRFSKQA